MEVNGIMHTAADISLLQLHTDNKEKEMIPPLQPNLGQRQEEGFTKKDTSQDLSGGVQSRVSFDPVSSKTFVETVSSSGTSIYQFPSKGSLEAYRAMMKQPTADNSNLVASNLIQVTA